MERIAAEDQLIPADFFFRKIYHIRNQYVLLAHDVKRLFDTEDTELVDLMSVYDALFPAEIVFDPDGEELDELLLQGYLPYDFADTSSTSSGARLNNRAFTEEGIILLALLLHSERAARLSQYLIQQFTLIRLNGAIHSFGAKVIS